MAEILKRVEQHLKNAKDSISRDVEEILVKERSLPTNIFKVHSRVGKKVVDQVNDKIDGMLANFKKLSYKML